MPVQQQNNDQVEIPTMARATTKVAHMVVCSPKNSTVLK